MIHQWRLAIYSDNYAEQKNKFLGAVIVWCNLSIESPDLTEVMENSSNPLISHMLDWLNSSSFVNLVETLF